MTDNTKVNWIRTECAEKFEGIPCDYPNCGCVRKNKEELEELFDQICPEVSLFYNTPVPCTGY